eukprot:10872180-Alexandrium_andersonii.AAC.1
MPTRRSSEGGCEGAHPRGSRPESRPPSPALPGRAGSCARVSCALWGASSPACLASSSSPHRSSDARRTRSSHAAMAS